MNYVLCFLMFFLCIAAIMVKNNEKKRELTTPVFEKYEKVLTIVLFAVGILVRIFYFWEYPAGFNQDEASIGYDVFADVNYGMDRNGYHNPVYSVAWGSGHSGLYIGLLNLVIRMFGLSVFSVRLVNVIFGCVALFAFYGILNRLKGKEAALIGLFFLIINPWHIMMCRWGLECNLFPNVFLIGLYFLIRGEEKPFWYYVSLFFFGLCLYAYGTSYMFLPVFLIIVAIYLFKTKKIKIKDFCIAAAIFIVTAIPIGIFMMVNFFGMEAPEWSFISFPKLVDGRYNTTVTVLNGSFLETVMHNLGVFFKMLITQNDGLIYNAIPSFGTLYIFASPLILLGLFSVIKDKKNKGRMILFSMLPASLVLAALSEVNINRGNIVFILLIYLAVEGILFILNWSKKGFFAVVSIFAIAFCLFTGHYFTKYQDEVAYWFFDGFGEAIQLAAEETDGKIYLSSKVNGPYVYALFYEEIDPKIFMETVHYLNPDSSVRYVESFDRFVTGLPVTINQETDAAYIVSPWENVLLPKTDFKEQKVGLFTVYTPIEK